MFRDVRRRMRAKQKKIGNKQDRSQVKAHSVMRMGNIGLSINGDNSPSSCRGQGKTERRVVNRTCVTDERDKEWVVRYVVPEGLGFSYLRHPAMNRWAFLWRPAERDWRSIPTYPNIRDMWAPRRALASYIQSPDTASKQQGHP